jgi:small-conductance mechanosensitive channel
MPKAIKLETATHIALNFTWLVMAVTVAYACGVALSWLMQRLKGRSAIIADIDVLTRRPVRAMLMVIAATTAVHHTSTSASGWRGGVDHALVIALMATYTWLTASLVFVAERRVISRFAGGDMEITDADLHRRKVRTQISLLRRLVVAVVVVFGLAAVLMTFPAFSNIGKTLFASAGVLSVVAGLAAQTSLAAVFAGIQIAFSDAVRVGDVVVVEEEWGRIEEITLTYVVVHLWDERRLVLPCTYFTKTPFQNWTRNATALMGTVELDVDFSVPLDAMRAELDRLLQSDELWDNRVGVLQVTDAIHGYVRVRMLVSASNAGDLFDLRCNVREGVVAWLQRAEAGSLPRRRIEHSQGLEAAAVSNASGIAGVPDSADQILRTGQPLAGSGLFSGSPEAEQRGREFARSRSRG